GSPAVRGHEPGDVDRGASPWLRTARGTQAAADLADGRPDLGCQTRRLRRPAAGGRPARTAADRLHGRPGVVDGDHGNVCASRPRRAVAGPRVLAGGARSEEHTSEL